jgi:hypothetical protein
LIEANVADSGFPGMRSCPFCVTIWLKTGQAYYTLWFTGTLIGSVTPAQIAKIAKVLQQFF